MNRKHLYRSLKDRKIAGIAGGLADYLNVDSTLVRLLWLLFIFIGGSGVLVYIIAWIAIPEETLAKVETETTSEETPVVDDHEPTTSQKKYSIIGLLLIVVGIFFLLKEFLPSEFSRYSWPFLLIALGFLLLIPRRKRSS